MKEAYRVAGSPDEKSVIDPPGIVIGAVAPWSIRACFWQCVTVVGIVLGLVGQACATSAYTLDNTGGNQLALLEHTFGSEFMTSAPIMVTGLGVFDDSLNGLGDSYPVGIWNSSGTMVASGTVASGIVDPLAARAWTRSPEARELVNRRSMPDFRRRRHSTRSREAKCGGQRRPV
jgi:hypothetical protein